MVADKTVDSRVLEMQFDNKNFEKNVSTSLSTLDKLKKALNFDDSAKSFDKVEKASKGLNFDKLISTCTLLEKRFSVFGEMSTVAIHRVTNSMIDLATKTVSFLTNGVVQGGLKRAMNLEQANFQLQGLLKNTEAVAAIMEDVSWSVDGTAYSLDAAAKAASMFAATGMRAGDEMKSALRGVAGVAAMTNSEYEGISQIFTTIAGQGRVMGDQLLQLASRGMNAAATLADYLTKVGDGAKVTEAEVREMVSKGKIDFATFAAAMDDAFGEHAKAANKTVQGAFANIKSALGRIGADFISPLIKQDRELVWLLNTIRKKINDIRTQTSPFAKETTTWLNDLIHRIAVFIKYLDFSYNSTTVRVVKLNFEALTNIATALYRVLLAIGAGFNDAFPEGLSTTIIVVSEKIRGLTERLIPSTKAFKNIRDFSRGFFTVLGDLAGFISGALSTAFGFLDKHLGKFNFSLTDIPGAVGRAITSLKELADGANVFLVPFGALAKAFEYSKEKVKGWIDTFLNLPKVQSAIEKVNEVMTPFIDKVKEFGGEGVKAFKDFINTAKETGSIDFSGFTNLFSNLGTIIQNGFKSAIGWFKELPKNIDSLKEAIGKKLGEIGEVFSNFWDNLGRGFQDLGKMLGGGKTVAAVLSGLLGVGLFKLLKDINNRIMPLVDALPRLIDSIRGVFRQLQSSIKDVSKGIKFEKIANGWYTIAKAVAVLATSLIVLSQVPAEKLQSGGIALGSLAGGLITLVGALTFFDKLGQSKTSIYKIGGSKGGIKDIATAMIAMAGSILILVQAVKSASSLGQEAIGGLAVITVLVAEMTGVYVAMQASSKTLGEDEKTGSSPTLAMIAFALSIKTMVGSMMDIAKMPLDKVVAGLGVISILIGELVALNVAMGQLGGGASEGAGLLMMAISIQILINAIDKIADMDIARIAKGEIVMTTLMGIFGLMAIVLNQGGNSSLETGGTLLAMAVAVLITAQTVEKLGKMDLATLAKGMAAVTALSLVFTGIAVMISTVGGEGGALKIAATLIAMSAAIAILSGVVILLGSMPLEVVAQGTIVVTALIAMFALLVASTKLANDCKSTLIIMTVAVGMLAAAIGLLSLQEPDRLFAASAALSMVLAMFALVVASTGLANDANATLVIMGLVVIELAGVLYALSDLSPESLLPSAEALSLLLISLAASFLIISKANDVSLLAVGTVALMGAVIYEIGYFLVQLQNLGLDVGIETAASLSLLLVALTAAIGIMTKLHVNVVAATEAAGAFDAFVVIVGALIIALGGLYHVMKENDLEYLLDDGITMLVKIAEGLGEFIGTLVTTAWETIVGALPGMGDDLSLFMRNLRPFIVGAKMIDSAVLQGVTYLVGAIVELTAAQMINGITKFLPFLGTMDDFGATLNAFGNAMVDFSGVVSGKIDPEAVVASATAAKAMSELKNALPRKGGKLQEWFGEKMDLGTWGENLASFGNALTRYSQTITANGGIKTKAITDSATAAQSLAELQNNLPTVGGKLQAWLGQTMDLATFGENLAAFGNCMVRYSQTITANGGLKVKAIEDSAKAAQLLADLQNSLPTVDGKLQEWFGGTMTLDAFGTNLVSFARALTSYSAVITGAKSSDGPIKPDAIRESSKAAGYLVDLQNELPDESGFFQDFFGGGTMDMGVWGQRLVEFGKALSNYSAQITLLNGINLGAIQESYDATMILIDLYDALPEKGWFESDVLGDFGKSLKLFGERFKPAISDITNTSSTSVKAAVENIFSMIGAMQSMRDIKSSDSQGFVDALKTLGESGVSAFVDAFMGSSYDVNRGILSFIDYAKIAIKNNQNGFINTFGKLVKDALDKIESYKTKFRDAGNTLVTEMSNGVKKANTAPKVRFEEALNLVLSTIKTSFNTKFRNAGEEITKSMASGVTAEKQTFVNRLNEVLTAGKNTISNESTNYKKSASTMMNQFVAGVNEAKPLTTSAVSTMLSDMLKITNSKQSEFKTAGSKLMSSTGSGMSSQSGNVQSVGKSVIDGIYNVIHKYGDKNNKFWKTGEYYADAIANGVDYKAYRALSTAQRLAENMDLAIRRTLKINSPSKVGFETASYYGESIQLGLASWLSRIYDTSTELGQNLDNGLSNAIDSAMTLISERFQLHPVITPEVDADNALATVAQLNSLFDNPRTFATASVIRARMSVPNQNGILEATPAEVNYNYDFTQNNYSPKAISRIEVYRQTNNQFTAFKEATATK